MGIWIFLSISLQKWTDGLGININEFLEIYWVNNVYNNKLTVSIFILTFSENPFASVFTSIYVP